ncbi:MULTISPECIES: hypothetical protein [Bradyrhizobium]|jgi:hypothetical protein|nr:MULTISPECIES: hypothetical protein [Bradyrhizobium]MCS3452015.1 hypothetical protein [Bradyrhizobium elkanii]MCS3565886.1 hypothetical protein [Bradyrhizobium elkanii]MCW2153384.1 hypothetical protein [Bradyrhizobium elkanii]MCW2356930.1 hypothetical protein [Bradyrhizobium elkanii]MCW2377117.1 hypothetical protein [Bradyrhizobium elkanii]
MREAIIITVPILVLAFALQRERGAAILPTKPLPPVSARENN